jgi:V8-like Glu-specific endopeptidase
MNPIIQLKPTKLTTSKKHPNNSNGASALQITLSVSLICVSLILFASISGAGPAASRSQGVVMSQGELTSFTAQGNGKEVLPDFVNMKPMPLPRAQGPIDMVPSLQDLGTPGFAAGAVGNGQTNPITLPSTKFSDMMEGLVPEGPVPEEFGTSNQPFSTARADLLNLATNTAYPYRVSGQLTFQKPNDPSTWYCSASMIKRGVVVTAAHCVANYGQQQFYSNWHFYPGRRNGVAPYGDNTVYQAWIKSAYFNGTDNCAQYGVICPDDVAVLILNPNNGVYAGSRTGWYGYGWNGWGFANGITHITQVGYPFCLDNGALMERNDSQGNVSGSLSSNTIIGSLMCGGSSGGPWLNNFGIRPTLTGTSDGTAPNSNTVVGVTSWGYIDNAVKQQGASPFTSNNIVSLVTSACNSQPTACQ